MKKLVLLSVFALCAIPLFSQSYSSAVGLRLGSPIAVTYKTFINETTALEGIIGFASFDSFVNYTNIRAAYLIHEDIGSMDNFQWYYGGGAGIFLWNYKSSFVGVQDGNTGIGLSGYIGLEYTFPDTPVSLSLDWAPTFILGGFGSGFGAGYGALAARYIIGR